MPFIHRTAGLIPVLLLASVACAPAQVPDSAGVHAIPAEVKPAAVNPAGVLPAPPDSGRHIDSAAPPPLDGVGSLSPAGLPLKILTDTTLKFTPFRSTDDLLSRFDGIFTTGTGVGGFRANFFVNGLREGAVVFTADGLPLNDPSTGLYGAGTYPVDFARSLEFTPSLAGVAGAFSSPGGPL